MTAIYSEPNAMYQSHQPFVNPSPDQNRHMPWCLFPHESIIRRNLRANFQWYKSVQSLIYRQVSHNIHVDVFYMALHRSQRLRGKLLSPAQKIGQIIVVHELYCY